MNRAQSETVGFVLVFALIAVSTGVVYVAGTSSLDDARTAEELNNMERAFDVLAENIGEVSRDRAPSRTTELRLGNGDIELGAPVNITVTTNVSAIPVTIHTRPIVYRLDDTEIVYTSGAVLRSDRGATAIRSEPDWVVSERQTILPLTDVDATGRAAMGGDTTVLVRARQKNPPNSRSFATNESAVNVTVTIDSPRSGAWRRLLESRGFSCDPPGVNCTFTTDELHVVWSTTSVEFSP
ncbi:DUF7289 family protein [Haloplanus halobius]|uniref:DUF7289 family protein n=1 Tax=Haloplanus halobius TaxID=2934938 RepID=UPI00200EB076|nr:hypothetical protein [Haloplanus sp. XH21]